jgi:hypothetical protein
VTGTITYLLKFTERQIDELITEAEQLAFARGLSPSMAT